MSYLLDSDVLIRAKNDHYGFDFCPGFWAWLLAAHNRGVVFSVDRVSDEVLRGGDDLADWVKQLPSGFFRETDAMVLRAFADVLAWAQGQGFPATEIDKFARGADGFLVAHALCGGHAVVSYEAAGQPSTKRIKIPDACAALGVPYLKPGQMLRAEQARFVLAA